MSRVWVGFVPPHSKTTFHRAKLVICLDLFRSLSGTKTYPRNGEGRLRRRHPGGFSIRKPVTRDQLCLRMGGEQRPQVGVPRAGGIAAGDRLAPHGVDDQVGQGAGRFRRLSVRAGGRDADAATPTSTRREGRLTSDRGACHQAWRPGSVPGGLFESAPIRPETMTLVSTIQGWSVIGSLPHPPRPGRWRRSAWRLVAKTSCCLKRQDHRVVSAQSRVRPRPGNDLLGSIVGPDTSQFQALLND